MSGLPSVSCFQQRLIDAYGELPRFPAKLFVFPAVTRQVEVCQGRDDERRRSSHQRRACVQVAVINPVIHHSL